MHPGVFVQTIRVFQQLVRLTFPEYTSGDIFLIDDTDTELQQIFGFRFGGGVIQEREFLHLTVREVVPVSRFFFYQYFIRSQIVRVLIEKIESLYQ